MTTLNELIQTHAAAAATAANWPAVAGVLNAKTVTITDTTLRTARWLMNQLTVVLNPATGMTESDVVLGTLQAATVPRIKAAYDSLVSDGLDLSNSQIQAMLPAISTGASWPAGLANKIMTAGVWLVSPAENAGLGSVTAEQCSDAWNLGLKEVAVEFVRNTAAEAAQQEYRKSGSTPASIIAAAITSLGGA